MLSIHSITTFPLICAILSPSFCSTALAANGGSGTDTSIKHETDEHIVISEKSDTSKAEISRETPATIRSLSDNTNVFHRRRLITGLTRAADDSENFVFFTKILEFLGGLEIIADEEKETLYSKQISKKNIITQDLFGNEVFLEKCCYLKLGYSDCPVKEKIDAKLNRKEQSLRKKDQLHSRKQSLGLLPDSQTFAPILSGEQLKNVLIPDLIAELDEISLQKAISYGNYDDIWKVAVDIALYYSGSPFYNVDLYAPPLKMRLKRGQIASRLAEDEEVEWFCDDQAYVREMVGNNSALLDTSGVSKSSELEKPTHPAAAPASSPVENPASVAKLEYSINLPIKRNRIDRHMRHNHLMESLFYGDSTDDIVNLPPVQHIHQMEGMLINAGRTPHYGIYDGVTLHGGLEDEYLHVRNYFTELYETLDEAREIDDTINFAHMNVFSLPPATRKVKIQKGVLEKSVADEGPDCSSTECDEAEGRGEETKREEQKSRVAESDKSTEETDFKEIEVANEKHNLFPLAYTVFYADLLKRWFDYTHYKCVESAAEGPLFFARSIYTRRRIALYLINRLLSFLLEDKFFATVDERDYDSVAFVKGTRNCFKTDRRISSLFFHLMDITFSNLFGKQFLHLIHSVDRTYQLLVVENDYSFRAFMSEVVVRVFNFFGGGNRNPKSKNEQFLSTISEYINFGLEYAQSGKPLKDVILAEKSSILARALQEELSAVPAPFHVHIAEIVSEAYRYSVFDRSEEVLEARLLQFKKMYESDRGLFCDHRIKLTWGDGGGLEDIGRLGRIALNYV